MTPAQFDQLFTREALRPFQPTPGSLGLAPMLEVRTPTALAVFLLDVAGFNDWDTRQASLYGLGAKCAHDHPQVEAVRFGSEAWVRTFTPDEAAARGARLVETYADKEEIIVVVGQLASGASRLARARLFRRAEGTIERLGSWAVRALADTAAMRSPLLAAFWQGYRQGTASAP